MHTVENKTAFYCNIIGEPRIGKSSLLYYLYRKQAGLPEGMKGVYVWLRLVELSDYSSTALVYEDARSDFWFDGHVRGLCRQLFARRTVEEKQVVRERPFPHSRNPRLNTLPLLVWCASVVAKRYA